MAKPDYPISLSEACVLFTNDYLCKNPTVNAALTWGAGEHESNGIIVDDPFNSGRVDVLKVNLYEGMYKLGASKVFPPRPSGVSCTIKDAIPESSELYIAMDVAFPIGFKHNWACHYMSLLSSTFTASTDPALLGTQVAAFFQMGGPNSYDNMSTYKHANEPGTLSCYYYDALKAQGHKYYNPLDPTSPHSNGTVGPLGEYFTAPIGRWFRWEMHVKLNDIGQANGVMQAWVDGQLLLDLHNRTWITAAHPNVKFTRAQFQTWYGGSDQEWAAHENQSIYFDNIIVSENPITHANTDYIMDIDWDYFTAPHVFTANSELDNILYISESTDHYGIQGIETHPTMSVVVDPKGEKNRNVLKVLFPADNDGEGDYESMRVHCGFGPSWTNVPYNNPDPWGSDYLLGGPNYEPTDPVWDYHNGAPIQWKFSARTERRKAGTEIAFEELYFSYDLMLSANWHYDFATKLNGLCTGSHLQSSHGPRAIPEGTYGTSWRCQMHNSSAYGNDDGALCYYLYDSERVQASLFLRRDGVLEDRIRFYDYREMDWTKQYIVPRDTWITIETRVKLNSAPVLHTQDPGAESTYDNNKALSDGCLHDGLIEVWITDPRPPTDDPLTGGTGGISLKMLTYTTRFRWHEGWMIDKFQLNAYTNRANDPPDITHPEDQFMYMTNNIVSTVKIN